MIITTLALSFLLSFLPLVIGTSYKLFETAQMKQAYLGLQYVSIVGGIVMIIAGLLWVGYFRALMKSRAPAKKTTAQTASVSLVEEELVPTEKAKAAPKRRREKPAPTDDWFADELSPMRSVKMAAKVSRKKATPAGQNKSISDN